MNTNASEQQMSTRGRQSTINLLRLFSVLAAQCGNGNMRRHSAAIVYALLSTLVSPHIISIIEAPNRINARCKIISNLRGATGVYLKEGRQ